ncbi:MAG: hypothetical protein A2X78_00035 [Gammaproteobacteria bacterium GWE2_37_16]|nr:MAG: hypothetical protein A2X78_00035 [Gammaproteobacteria bacterium GWE2_37_16]
MRILFYKTNKFYVRDFIRKLNTDERTEILSCLENIEKFGFDSSVVQFRHIRKKLWEIKISVDSNGYRIFYVAVHGDTIVLLHAYKKKSQKAPIKEIAVAEKRLLEVLKDEICYIN